MVALVCTYEMLFLHSICGKEFNYFVTQSLNQKFWKLIIHTVRSKETCVKSYWREASQFVAKPFTVLVYFCPSMHLMIHTEK